MEETLVKRDIMLAEDDNDDVLIFEIAMAQAAFPYALRHAKDGEVLFIMLKEKIPYILFLDINIPCKDGVACINEIRKNRDYDNMPVIMFTSNMAKSIMEECFRSGANYYMVKSNTINGLVDNLKKVFSIDWENYMHYPPQNQFILS